MPFFSDFSVDDAFVVRLPKKSWEWLAPGWLGRTIGSSARRCENVQRVTKRGFISAGGPPTSSA